ncbi:MAG TPA: D-cysteine desulfhydrase family protein [Vicinamibacterales bacterium]|nr:D-cysteine desulfhydrase family protein [Vicinamibacterales bacterium]
MTPADLRQHLQRFASLPLVGAPTPVEPLPQLSSVLGGGPRLLVKRDDAIAFAFGGNKVRKLAYVGADAKARGADTLITAGGVQSNHARVTAAAAAKLGMRAVLVANGEPPGAPTANALLDRLLGAGVVYVPTRDDRAPKMAEIAERLRSEGRRPYVIPVGASIPLGALGFVAALLELLDQIPAPDVIVHSSSSGGTQAGLVAACRLLGVATRIVGISADARSTELQAEVRPILRGLFELLELDAGQFARGTPVEIDDAFVGDGYGIPTDASREAIELVARTEALFLDPVYTAKAMAALIAYVRQQRFTAGQTIVFWHTGGQVALFA